MRLVNLDDGLDAAGDGDISQGDPTPAEIARRAKAIRRQWSAKKRTRRRTSITSVWRPPFISAADVAANLSAGSIN